MRKSNLFLMVLLLPSVSAYCNISNSGVWNPYWAAIWFTVTFTMACLVFSIIFWGTYRFVTGYDVKKGKVLKESNKK